MAVKVPRIQDRGKENIRFTSNLIPQYMRRTITIDVLLLSWAKHTDPVGADFGQPY